METGSVEWVSEPFLNKVVRTTLLRRYYLSKDLMEVRGESKWLSGEETEIPHPIFDFIGTLGNCTSAHAMECRAGVGRCWPRGKMIHLEKLGCILVYLLFLNL